MIVLTRKVGQRVYLKVGEQSVVLKVMDTKGTIVRLAVVADPQVKVTKTLKDHLERDEG